MEVADAMEKRAWLGVVLVSVGCGGAGFTTASAVGPDAAGDVAMDGVVQPMLGLDAGAEPDGYGDVWTMLEAASQPDVRMCTCIAFPGDPYPCPC
jgi:hypothetical protein